MDGGAVAVVSSTGKAWEGLGCKACIFPMTCHDSVPLNVLARGANMGSIGVALAEGPHK